MANISSITGVILIILGLVSYFGTGQTSVTALIPSFFGIVFIILGLAGRKENLRKHAMHGAAGIALLGLLGSGRGLIGVFSLLGGGDVERPEAVMAQAAMAIICLGFLILAIKSFIDARRAESDTPD